MAQAKPIKLLIAALGGEGGGVLASWLHAAAIASGHFVQGTSIPGVAQRTGATTYYLEMVPGAGARHAHAARAPCWRSTPAPGEVDLVVASELLEATRAIGAGFVTPDRTVLIASSARVFTIDEKTAMGDGRLDRGAHAGDGRALLAPRRRSPTSRPSQRKAKSPLNAVLLGAIAASGVLPIAGGGVPRRHPRRGQGGGCQPARLRGWVGRGSDPAALRAADR